MKLITMWIVHAVCAALVTSGCYLLSVGSAFSLDGVVGVGIMMLATAFIGVVITFCVACDH